LSCTRKTTGPTNRRGLTAGGSFPAATTPGQKGHLAPSPAGCACRTTNLTFTSTCLARSRLNNHMDNAERRSGKASSWISHGARHEPAQVGFETRLLPAGAHVAMATAPWHRPPHRA
jgi:hypothetical protein